MTAAICSECGAKSQANHGRATIVHNPGCSVGHDRQALVALAALQEATAQYEAAKRELKRCRGMVVSRAESCVELGTPKTLIAEESPWTRKTLYNMLEGG